MRGRKPMPFSSAQTFLRAADQTSVLGLALMVKVVEWKRKGRKVATAVISLFSADVTIHKTKRFSETRFSGRRADVLEKCCRTKSSTIG